MSEWYENKTIEQLDGKRVRVGYENGTMLEGNLRRSGSRMLQICFDYDGAYSRTVLDDLVRKDKPQKFEDKIKSVTLLDDDDMTRIDDIDDVRSGDTFVGTDGKQFKVIDVDFNNTRFRLRVTFAGGEFWIKNDYFAYALRPKPQLPTEPGLYGDTGNSNRLWRLETAGWRLLIGADANPNGSPFDEGGLINALRGAMLYPVEIKRVES